MNPRQPGTPLTPGRQMASESQSWYLPYFPPFLVVPTRLLFARIHPGGRKPSSESLCSKMLPSPHTDQDGLRLQTEVECPPLEDSSNKPNRPCCWHLLRLSVGYP